MYIRWIEYKVMGIVKGLRSLSDKNTSLYLPRMGADRIVLYFGCHDNTRVSVVKYRIRSIVGLICACTASVQHYLRGELI